MASAGAEPPLHPAEFPLETVRGTAGHVRAGRTRSGAWWLLDAEDLPLVVCGLHLGPGSPRAADAVRAAAWGVNTLVVDGPVPPAGWSGHWIGTAGFRHALPEALIRFQGAVLPDVFDPRWARACAHHAAAVCPPGASDPRLIGWMADADLHWAQRPAGSVPGPARPALLQVCLSLEPGFAAYHAAWEFVLAEHGGDLAGLAAAWDLDLPNKETLRQFTRDDRVVTGAGYDRDDARFTREFSRLYFATTSTALRDQDPAHLVIGSIPARGGRAVAEGAAPLVDVLAVGPNPGLPESLPEEWGRSTACPILLTGYSWTEGAASGRADLTPLERMLARGRAELGAALTQPAVIGYAWRDWCDEPDDRAPFGRGLVRVDGATAREHTDLLAEINLGAVRRRQLPHS